MPGLLKGFFLQILSECLLCVESAVGIVNLTVMCERQRDREPTFKGERDVRAAKGCWVMPVLIHSGDQGSHTGCTLSF